MSRSRHSRRGGAPRTGDGDARSLIGAARDELAAGNRARARELAELAVARFPQSAAAAHLSGAIACGMGDWAAALDRLTRAIELDDTVPAHHANFGLAAWRTGDYVAAEVAFRRALALNDRLAAAANNLGSLLRERGRLEESAAAFGRALAAEPDFAEAESNLAVTLRDLGRMVEAERVARSAVTRRPDNPTNRINLATILKERGDRDGAEAELVAALGLAPDDPLAVCNLALLRERAGRLMEAEAMYRHAMRDPDHRALAAWNLALLSLRRGRMAEGFALYEERFAAAPDPELVVPDLPRWRGEPLAGRTLLIWREQGLGDEVMFGGLIPHLLAHPLDHIAGGGRVVVAVEPRLAGLFARALPGVEVRPAPVGRPLPLADADAQCPLGSLPGLLWRGLSDVATAPWLAPTPDRLRHWRDRLAALGPGLKIGVAWRGHVSSGERWRAYLRREDLAPLAAVPGVQLINLQHDAGEEECGCAPFTLRHWPDLDLRHDLEGVAGLIAACDLVVSVACSVGEMAAALGVPVWRIGGPDWTGLGTAVRPWYPAMRPWPPKPGRSLADVVPDMARALASLAVVFPSVSDTVDDALREARELVARGRAPEAEKAYQDILARRPDHGGALAGYARLALDHGRPDLAVTVLNGCATTGEGAVVLGLAFQMLGDAPSAHRWLRFGVIAEPGTVEVVGNLAAMATVIGAEDAHGWAKRAAILAPFDPGPRVNRALAARAEGDTVAATRAVRRALSLDPASAAAWKVGALLAIDGAEGSGALAAARHAVELAGDDAEAHGALGLASSVAGLAEEAVAAHRAALRLSPSNLPERINLAAALEAAGEADAAAWAWWRVILLDPGGGEGFAGLAALRAGQDRHDAALRGWGRALIADPDRGEWHYNRGNAFYALGRLAEAEACYARAADVSADFDLATFNRGHAALARGDLPVGWSGLESRFAAGQALPNRHFRAPRWRGGELNGGDLLIWREQGVGDEFMFATCYRAAMDLARANGAGRVLIDAEPRLVGLLARSFPDAVVTAQPPLDVSDPRPLAAQIPAGSLPSLLRLRVSDFPAAVEPMRADPERSAVWRHRLAALPPGLKVGICWRSGLVAPGRAAAHTRLEDWAPLFAVEGVQWINLQYDDAAEEIASARDRWGVILHRWDDVDLKSDLETAAALTAELDLVISAGTSVAEMAGALGVPVWRLSRPAEWSALGVGCRPWYPSMRSLLPMKGEDGFAGALTRAARALTALRPESAPPPPPKPPIASNPSLAEGMTLHRAGDLTGAESHYRGVLAGNPRDADAAHLLGMVATASGRHEEAVGLFERAIDINRRAPDFHANLAYGLFALGRREEAIVAARRALKLKPDHPQAANTLGNALSAQGRWREAVGAYRAALRGASGYVEAAANLGVALSALEEDGEAGPTLRAALARLPTHGPAWGALAQCLERGRDLPSAERAYRLMLSVQPGNPAAWEGLGRVEEALGAACGRDGAGVPAWTTAVRVAPELTAVWNGLGVAARFAGDAGGALNRFVRGLILEPGAAGNLSNVALGLQDTGDGRGAERLFARAGRVDPTDGLARFNHGLMALSAGRWAEGWAAHEGRLAAPSLFRRPEWPIPPWRGEDLSGRHILVWREQGVGDELMHAGLLPALIARAGRVSIAAERRLVGLFARSFPGARVVGLPDAVNGTAADGSVLGERVDFQVAAGSLPGLLHGGLGELRPPETGWLVPEPATSERWRARLAGLGPGLKIGFAWTSRKTDQGRARAYAALSAWAPLFAVPGVRWISLQYDGRGDELADIRLPDGTHPPVFAPVAFADADLTDDLETAAALTAACDLVISVASSVSEMAGALGRPVWRVGGRDWTWLGTGTRPWYPTMRVWAPRAGDGMDDVIARMAGHLRSLELRGRGD